MSYKGKKTLGTIVGAAIAIIVSLLVYNFIGPKSTQVREMEFPQEIQGIKQSEVVSGPPAIAMISKLHGTDIVIREGYIANYEGDGSQITIWVSESGSQKEADQLFDVMDRKIEAAASSPGAPFKDRREFTRNGKKVIEVKGMGMYNYFYKSDIRVYWTAVGGTDSLKALDDIMKTLP